MKNAAVLIHKIAFLAKISYLGYFYFNELLVIIFELYSPFLLI